MYVHSKEHIIYYCISRYLVQLTFLRKIGRAIQEYRVFKKVLYLPVSCLWNRGTQKILNDPGVLGPDLGRSVNILSTRGDIMPTTLTLAPRIFRPSYGPEN